MSKPGATETAPSQPEGSVWRRLLWAIIAVVLMSAALIALLLLPAVQTRIVNGPAAGILRSSGINLQVDDFHINFFSGIFTCRGLELHSAAPHPYLDVTIDSVQGDIALFSLLKTPEITTLEVRRPNVTLRPWELPESEPATEKSSDLPGFILSKLTVSGGRFEMAAPDPESTGMVLDGIGMTGGLDLAPLMSRGEIHVETLALTGSAPLETTGATTLMFNLTGKGAGTGTLMSEVNGIGLNGRFSISDLLTELRYSAELKLDGVPDPLLEKLAVTDLTDGAVALAATVQGRPDGLDTFDLTLTGRGFSVSGVPVATAQFTGEFPDFATLNANLTVQAAGGELALETSGIMVPEPDNFRVRATLKNMEITAVEPLRKALPGTSGRINGAADLTFSSWALDGISGTLKLDSANTRFKQETGSVQSAIGINATLKNGLLDIQKLKLTAKTFSGTITGKYNLIKNTMDITSILDFTEISPVLSFANLTGSGAGIVNIRGSGSVDTPELKGRIQLKMLELPDYSCRIPELDARFENRRFTINIPGLEYSGISGTVLLTGAMPDANPAWQLNAALTGLRHNALTIPDLNAAVVMGDRIELVLTSPDSWISGSAAYTEDKQLVVDAFRLTMDGGGYLNSSGRANIATGTMDVTVETDLPDLAFLEPFLAGASGKLAGNIHLGGTFERPEPLGTVSLTQFHLPGLDVESLALHFSDPIPEQPVQANLTSTGIRWETLAIPDSRFTCGVDGSQLQLTGQTRDGQLMIDAMLDLKDEMVFSGEISLHTFDLAPTLTWLVPDLPLTGSLTGGCLMSGSIESIREMTADIALSEVSLTGRRVMLQNRAPINLGLKNGELIVRSLDLRNNDNGIAIAGSLLLSGDPGSAAHQGLNVTAAVGLKTFLPFLEDLDQLEGRLTSDFRIAGSLEHPEILGEFKLEKGAVNGPHFPELRNIAGRAVFQGDTLRLESVTATVGTGTLRITGDFPLRPAGHSRSRLVINGYQLGISVGPEFDAVTDLALVVTFPDDKPLIKGSVEVSDALYTQEINLLELLQSITRKTVDFEQSFDFGQAETVPGILDISVVIPDSLTVQGDLLDIVAGGNLRVAGPWNSPVIKGLIRLPGGAFHILGTEFNLQSGSIQFADPYQIDPDLNIVAVTRKDGDEIMLRITGKTSQANLALSSASGLSQEQILKRLAGLDSDSEDSGESWDSALMDAAKRQVAEQFTRALGERTDLIIVPFPQTEDTEEMIFGVGKKVGEKITVMYYKSAKSEAGDAIAVMYEITPDTTIRVRQNSDDSISGGVSHQITFN